MGYQEMEDEYDEVVAFVVDSATGKQIDKIKYGDKVVHKKANDKKMRFLEANVVGFNKEKTFVKLYKGINELRKHLTNNEFTVAISLSDYVCYEDCILRKGGTHKGKILTIRELSEEMEIEYDSLRKTITSLVKKGVLGIHKTGNKDNPNIMTKSILVNPYIFSRGSVINKTILGLFEETNW